MAENTKTVYVAIAAGAVIAVTKFVAAALSGSSSLLAEGLHSTADTFNDCMILLGQKRSEAPPDDKHPFGPGKELYFWTLVVAVSILTVGGLASILEGIEHVLKPERLENPLWNYVALGVAAVFEGYSWTVAWRQIKQEKKEDGDESIWIAIKNAKDPTSFLVLFEDTAAIVGLVIAFFGVFLSHLLRKPWIDGAGAVGVGLVLVGTAIFLISEIRELLVGERADPDQLRSVHDLVEHEPTVVRAELPRSMHFGPETVMLAVKAEFQPDISAKDVAEAANRIHDAIKHDHPDVKYIYIEPDVTAEKAGAS